MHSPEGWPLEFSTECDAIGIHTRLSHDKGKARYLSCKVWVSANLKDKSRLPAQIIRALHNSSGSCKFPLASHIR
jgi:hypothetical protein